MKIIIIAGIAYLSFYALHNLIDIFLEWLRCEIDNHLSCKRLQLVKMQDEIDKAREADDDSGATSAIGFEYVAPEDSEDEEQEEDSFLKRKHKKNLSR